MHPDEPAEQKLTGKRPDTWSSDGASVERTIGRHRAAEPARRGARARLTSTPFRVALATGVTCCLGVAAFAGVGTPGTTNSRCASDGGPGAAAAEADQRASRSLERSAAPGPVSPSPKPSPTVTRKPVKKPVKPKRPRPVAGLSQLQMDNAKVIVDVGRELKMPRRALVVALATAMQESDLYNLASDVLPESYDYPHQGSGADHDSVGLFQQRPSSGWGTVAELMRPAYAARVFFEALAEVPGWQELSVTAAAQAVQVSAFPDAYAPHEDRATTVVEALV
ncbi:hypothetical protein JNW88_20945 [Micromonospora sp. ATA32]|nr:hypothetical protein [Micromonospora sp. ATA32]